MTTVIHAWVYGREQPQEKDTSWNKLRFQFSDNFTNRDNLRASVRFRRESQPTILKYDFSSRTDPSIFVSIAPVLLDWSNKTS